MTKPTTKAKAAKAPAKATKGIPQRGKALAHYQAVTKGWQTNDQFNKRQWPKGNQACSWAVDCRKWAQASGLVACKKTIDGKVAFKLAKPGSADAKAHAMTS